MITFRALRFYPHELSAKSSLPISMPSLGSTSMALATQAQYNFKNGFGVSVLCGSLFYSNGIDTYELAVTRDGTITYNTQVTNDVMGYLTRAEVSMIMVEVQKLPKDHYVKRED